MAATIRQQIIDAIAARLKLIQLGDSFTVNGATVSCRSNIGDSVEIWRTRPLGDKEGWAVVVRDLTGPIDRTGEGAEIGRHLHRLAVKIDIVVKDRTAPDLVREMLADVMTAIGSDPKWGGLARWTDVEESALEVDDTGARMAGASLSLTVTYKTTLWQM